MFSMLDAYKLAPWRDTWEDHGNMAFTTPLYNIIHDEDRSVIRIAVPGYTLDDIEITRSDYLYVRGTGNNSNTEFLKPFSLEFQIGQRRKVQDATLLNGILTITLVTVPIQYDDKIEVKRG